MLLICRCGPLVRAGVTQLLITTMYDDTRMLTHSMQALRAAEYARAEAAGQSKTALKGLAKQLGCSGDPSIFRRLSYLDRNDVFALPIYHTAILGTLKDFLGMLVSGPHFKFGAGVVNKLDAFASCWVVTCDFGRRPEPIRYAGLYQIEQGMRFLEFSSCFLFKEEVVGFQALSPIAKKAWGCLRRWAMFIFRGGEEDNASSPLSLEAAQAELLRYAQLVEQVRAGGVCI